MHIFLRFYQLAGETCLEMAAFPCRSSEIFYGWYREAAAPPLDQPQWLPLTRSPERDPCEERSAKRDHSMKPLPGHFHPKIDPPDRFFREANWSSPERDPSRSEA
ncbi:hypothetical protein [Henriciella mobilis]|uniref:hypothetical protein n=1 Tax=Henriciella mobilis TaxID=2305467 RepID=UPI0013146A37|nr:hypothetical protein [Henriciella mobilis]